MHCRHLAEATRLMIQLLALGPLPQPRPALTVTDISGPQLGGVFTLNCSLSAPFCPELGHPSWPQVLPQIPGLQRCPSLLQSYGGG